MCGRYLIDDEMISGAEGLVDDSQLEGQTKTGEIHPTEVAPVIIAQDNQIVLTQQTWGYSSRFQQANRPKTIFNARSETVFEKKTFFSGITNHRAVIPVRAFYEWNKNKEMNTFDRIDEEIMLLAGFYDSFDAERRFVILTTEANSSVSAVHDRMPLVLEQNQLKEWLFDDKQTKNILCQTPVLLNRSYQSNQQMLF